MKTMQDWKTSFEKDFNPGDEVSEEVYYHNLEVLPPIYLKPGFQVSEPYDHEDNGHARYSTFLELKNRYFYLGIHSTRQATELIKTHLQYPLILLGGTK